MISRTRELLKLVAIEHHLHICDSAQHLLLELAGDADEEDAEEEDAGDAQPAIRVDEADLIRVVQLRDAEVAEVGLQLVDDPFDLDAYVADEPADADADADAGVAQADAGDAAAQDAAGVADAVDAADGAPKAEGERRHSTAAAEAEMRRGLTPQQLATLDTMSQFGWTLRFVRRPLFQPPMPVAFDRNRQRYVVVEPDGSVDEAPALDIRDGIETRDV